MRKRTRSNFGPKSWIVAAWNPKPLIFQDNAKKFLREKTFPFLLWPSHLITRHIAKFWQRFYGTQPEYETHRSRREAEKMFAWDPLAKNSRGQRHRAKTILLWPGQFIFTDLTFSWDKKVTDRPVELANVWRGGVVMSLCENRDWLLSIEYRGKVHSSHTSKWQRMYVIFKNRFEILSRFLHHLHRECNMSR